MSRWVATLLHLSSLLVAGINAANQIKGLDDSILFRINWAGTDSSLLGSPDYEKLVMTSASNEHYQCLIPISFGEKNEEADTYTGPGPFTLLKPLLQKHTCNLRLESYWTYELCHGAHIKQYREERHGKSSRLHEYVLGEFLPDDLTALKNAVKETEGSSLRASNVPTTKVEGQDMPYFMVNYTQGTVCDLTGRPRISHVLYVCYDEGRHDIYTIKEIYTCEYEIVVLSPLLCLHPAYRPRDVPQTSLHCIPMEGSPKRPRSLLQIEAESLKLRTHGAILSGDTSRGSVKLEIVEGEGAGDNDDDEEDEDSDSSSTWSPTFQNRVLFQKRPGVDHKLVEDFLNGDYCLHGGAGWWKFEFCYARKVEQYHEDRDGDRITILLGKFSLKQHKAWLEQNPHKKPQRSSTYSMTHFYSGGTICDVTGRPRQVEVRLKCKESNSPSAVTLYLLEPKVCEYILGIETQIVCWLGPDIDEYGLYNAGASPEVLEQMFLRGLEEEKQDKLGKEKEVVVETKTLLVQGKGETHIIEEVEEEEVEEEVEDEEEEEGI